MSELGLERDFQLIEDRAEALSLLGLAAKIQASLLVWIDQENTAHSSRLLGVDPESGTIEAEWSIDVMMGEFESLLTGHEGSLCICSVSLPSILLFFKAAFRGKCARGIRFALPEKVFRVQRRADVRITFPPDMVVKALFRDPRRNVHWAEKRLLDLSAGGLAFLIEESEKTHYPVDTRLEELTLKLHECDVRLTGKVLHVRKLPPRSGIRGYKVGVSFAGILPGESQRIARYVFEESRKLFSRLV